MARPELTPWRETVRLSELARGRVERRISPDESQLPVIARTIAQKLSDRWGQQVVVDNKVGGNSIIGAVEAMRAAPDGVR